MKKILEINKPLKEGRILGRPNRFTLRVNLENEESKVYLRNPGALTTVFDKNNKVYCSPVENKENRKTHYDAIAIKTGKTMVTVDSTLANEIAYKVIEKNLIEKLSQYRIEKKEPSIKENKRSDLLLKNGENDRKSYVEIKSCTHVEEGVAKFPDRPTKRGREHVKILTEMQDIFENRIIFVVQRRDAESFSPFYSIDEKFGKLLEKAFKNGVKIRAISTYFDPPSLFLADDDLPIDLRF